MKVRSWVSTKVVELAAARALLRAIWKDARRGWFPFREAQDNEIQMLSIEHRTNPDAPEELADLMAEAHNEWLLRKRNRNGKRVTSGALDSNCNNR